MPTESYPAAARSSVPYLGRYGTVDALAAAGVVEGGQVLSGLPRTPVRGGRSFDNRTRRALRDIGQRFPLDHVLLAPDLMLVNAARDIIEVPATIMLPASASRDVAAHFAAAAGSTFGVSRVPDLPTGKGGLPALLLLGVYRETTSYLHPEDKLLLDVYSSSALGLVILIDPGDPDHEPVTNWRTVWPDQLTGAYRPADTEGDIE